MNERLSYRLQALLTSARGLDEPKYDAHTQIENWPRDFVHQVKALYDAILGSGDSSELRACADILNGELPGVPKGLLHILAYAVSDNPDTPFRES
jgi:hypothetical protein